MYLHATDKVLKDDNLLALSTSQNHSGRACVSLAVASPPYDHRSYGFLYG